MFSRWLQHHPDSWHLNRRSVSVRLAIGLFRAFMPLPLQMVPSTAMSVLLRGNIPAAIAGAWIFGVPTHDVAIEISWTWITQELAISWRPFLLGCIIVGAASAATG